jgi:hypothetical protein
MSYPKSKKSLARRLRVELPRPTKTAAWEPPLRFGGLNLGEYLSLQPEFMSFPHLCSGQV